MKTVHSVITPIVLLALQASLISAGYFLRNDGAETSERDLAFRALLCPDTPREILPFYRFHLTSRSCYQVGTQGPCGSHMLFTKQPFTRAVGRCVCHDVEETSTRPMVRHPDTNNCYYVYRQGYCAADQWLVLDPDTEEGSCELNPCLELGVIRENEVSYRELVPLGGECAELGTMSALCSKDQVVGFLDNRPGCRNLTSNDNEILE